MKRDWVLVLLKSLLRCPSITVPVWKNETRRAGLAFLLASVSDEKVNFSLPCGKIKPYFDTITLRLWHFTHLQGLPQTQGCGGDIPRFIIWTEDIMSALMSECCCRAASFPCRQKGRRPNVPSTTFRHSASIFLDVVIQIKPSEGLHRTTWEVVASPFAPVAYFALWLIR